MQTGKHKCPICKGHGEVDMGYSACILVTCTNCKGTGEVDWVRFAMPVKQKSWWEAINDEEFAKEMKK